MEAPQVPCSQSPSDVPLRPQSCRILRPAIQNAKPICPGAPSSKEPELPPGSRKGLLPWPLCQALPRVSLPPPSSQYSFLWTPHLPPHSKKSQRDTQVVRALAPWISTPAHDPHGLHPNLADPTGSNHAGTTPGRGSWCPRISTGTRAAPTLGTGAGLPTPHTADVQSHGRARALCCYQLCSVLQLHK
jgi:hypothetical protein